MIESNQAQTKVFLPAPDMSGGLPMWAAIARRRSVRQYSMDPIELSTLSQLLWATQGTTFPGRTQFRAAPSAGAAHPINTYILANSVSSLASGLYTYDPIEHAIHRAGLGATNEDLSQACLGQGIVLNAAVDFIWTAVPKRSRSARYIQLEAGHISENLYLACAALGLGCCAVGAFNESKVNSLLGVDGIEETTIYLSSVGTLK